MKILEKLKKRKNDSIFEKESKEDIQLPEIIYRYESIQLKLLTKNQSLIVVFSIQLFIHGIIANGLIQSNFFNIANRRKDPHLSDNSILLKFILISQIMFIINSFRNYINAIRKCYKDSKNIKYLIQDIVKTITQENGASNQIQDKNESKKDIQQQQNFQKEREIYKEIESIQKPLKVADFQKQKNIIRGRILESLISIFLGFLFGLTFSQIVKDIFTLVFKFKVPELYNYSRMKIFLSSLGIYHFWEYLFKAKFKFKKNKNLDWHDFQIDHSYAYGAAMMMCLSEYYLRQLLINVYQYQFLQYLDQSIVSKFISVLGLIMMMTGHFFRISSMHHAGSNFTHLVQTKKQEDHDLVTTGVYSFSRHPSYFGWFTWAVGTQLLLNNYFCFPLWFYAAFTFFQDRIPHEEYYLVKFFGNKYKVYAQRTPIRIPFVKGYIEQL